MPSVLVAVFGCPPTPIWSSHFASPQDPIAHNRVRSLPLRQATVFATSPGQTRSLLRSLPTLFDLEHFRAIRHSGYTAHTLRALDARLPRHTMHVLLFVEVGFNSRTVPQR